MSSRRMIFTSSPLGKKEVKLGSLVSDRQQPNQDALAPDHLITLTADEISCVTEDEFSNTLSEQTNKTFRASLTKLLSTSIEHEPASRIELVAGDGSASGLQSKRYTLVNPHKVFRELCAVEEARRWLEDGYRDGLSSYLVVGVRTLCDARVNIFSRSSDQVAGAANVPVGDLVGVPLPNQALDVVMEGSNVYQDGEHQQEIEVSQQHFCTKENSKGSYERVRLCDQNRVLRQGIILDH